MSERSELNAHSLYSYSYYQCSSSYSSYSSFVELIIKSATLNMHILISASHRPKLPTRASYIVLLFT